MQIQNRIFIDGSRGPLSAVGGRPVQVINAVLRIRAQKFRSSASFRAGRRGHRIDVGAGPKLFAAQNSRQTHAVSEVNTGYALGSRRVGFKVFAT